jgi:uncharacterized OsmC-like protein
MVAKELSMSLHSLEIQVSGDLDTSKLMGLPDAGRAGFSEVRATLKPVSGADETTLQKWVRTVDERCPISDTIAKVTRVSVVVSN